MVCRRSLSLIWSRLLNCDASISCTLSGRCVGPTVHSQSLWDRFDARYRGWIDLILQTGLSTKEHSLCVSPDYEKRMSWLASQVLHEEHWMQSPHFLTFTADGIQESIILLNDSPSTSPSSCSASNFRAFFTLETCTRADLNVVDEKELSSFLWFFFDSFLTIRVFRREMNSLGDSVEAQTSPHHLEGSGSGGGDGSGSCCFGGSPVIMCKTGVAKMGGG